MANEVMKFKVLNMTELIALCPKLNERFNGGYVFGSRQITKPILENLLNDFYELNPVNGYVFHSMAIDNYIFEKKELA